MADQKELLKLRGKLNNSRLDFGSAFNKYISENKVKAKRNGKWVWIDKSTGENWDDKIVETKINKQVFGTETPRKDLSYLENKRKLSLEKQRIGDPSKPFSTGDSFSQIRRLFSPKTENEGVRQIDVTRAEKIKQLENELKIEKLGTSFRPEIQPRTWQNPAMPKSPEPEITFDSTETSNTNQAKTPAKTSWENKVSGDGSGSDVSVSESKASGNNSNFKSDVFTINPETGKAVGVLTRSQRRAFEKKYGDKLDKLKIRTYRNKGNTYQRYG